LYCLTSTIVKRRYALHELDNMLCIYNKAQPFLPVHKMKSQISQTITQSNKITFSIKLREIYKTADLGG